MFNLKASLFNAGIPKLPAETTPQFLPHTNTELYLFIFTDSVWGK